MKKGPKIAACIISAIIIIYLILAINNTNILLSPFDPPLLADCTNSNIQTIWDLVFEESSASIQIITNTSLPNICEKYYAYKVSPEKTSAVAFLHLPEQNTSQLVAVSGNFTPSAISAITQINQNQVDGGLHILSLAQIAMNPSNTYSRTLSSELAAETEFNSLFKVTNTSAYILEQEIYKFDSTETFNGKEIENSGNVYANKILSIFAVSSELDSPSICVPNWQPQNSSCIQETITTHYVDSNNCGNIANKPQNVTFDSDCDGNGIIGNETDIESNFIPKVYVNNQQLNFSAVLNSTKNVELREGAISRATFTYNFSKPLNLREIEIEKQPASSGVGYLIIDGINAEKTLTIDKKNSTSNKICVADKTINSISSLSSNCNGINEEIIQCPGNVGEFSCAILNSGFVVTGLDHSAVKELLSLSPSNTTCTPNWNCTQYLPAQCAPGITQIRTCTDLSNCSTTTGKPPESQTCLPAANCITNWNCSSWNPQECPRNQTRTRNCVDLNSCGTTTGKPQEQQACKYASKTFTPKVIVLFVIILVTLGLFLILVIYLKRSFDKKIESSPKIIYNSESTRKTKS